MVAIPADPTPRSERSHQAIARAVLLLSVLSGAFLRLFHLGVQPLGFDEALSVFIAQGPIAEILSKNLVHNSSPPFMVLALHQMFYLGQSETIIRLLPALAGIATIPLVYTITRRLFTELAAALAALLFALSPAHISFSREFRIYEIGSLFAALAILVAIEFLRRPSPRWALITGATMFCGIQVQYGLAPLFATMIVVLVFVTYRSGLLAKRRALNLVIISSWAVAGVVTVYFSSLRAQFYPGRGGTYLGVYSGGVLENVVRLSVQTLNLWKYGFPSDVFIFLLGVGLVFLFRKNILNPAGLMFICSLGAIAVLGVLNYYPYAAVRQCLFLTILMYPIAAAGLQQFAEAIPERVPWWLGVWFVATLIGPTLLQDIRVLFEPRNPSNISAALKQMDHEFQEGDIVFVAPGAYPEFLYYGRNFRRSWVKGEGAEAWMSDERAWAGLVTNPPYVNQIETLMRSNKRVWLLSTHTSPGEPTLSTIAARRGWALRIQTRMTSPYVDLSLYQ